MPVPSELPQLLSLNLTMPAGGGGADAGTPLGLGNLSAMHKLTELVVAIYDLRDGPFAVLDQAYAAATMQPVAQALASLTALRTLQLSEWTTATSPAAHASWQALASALPTMPHLDTLCVKDIAVPGDFDPVLTNALSAGLSRLSSLRELILEGTGEFFAAGVPVTADFRVASARLAAAVGNLTGLRHLELNSLRRCLRLSDCRHHLRRLTQVSHLNVAHLVPVPTPGDATGGDGAEIVNMLSSMSQLPATVWRAVLCSDCAPHHR